MTSPLNAPVTAAPVYGDGALIVCDSLVRIFRSGPVEIQALQGLDLLVRAGEVVAIVGASGSGKSTLLGILSGLDTPSAGRALVAGRELGRLSARERLAFRRDVVGFVWQQTARNLLGYLTAVENVALPLAFAGVDRRTRERRARDLLGAMGLADLADRRPGEMSGGQQQRAAIATALANDPRVLLADEPTGELDRATGDEVFAALRKANSEFGTTVVIVTHDETVASEVQRTVAIRDGRTSTEVLRETTVDEVGASTIVAREYALIDRAGRLQLPAAYRDALELKGRVRLELEEDHVGLWPGQTPVPRPRPQAPSDGDEKRGSDA